MNLEHDHFKTMGFLLLLLIFNCLYCMFILPYAFFVIFLDNFEPCVQGRPRTFSNETKQNQKIKTKQNKQKNCTKKKKTNKTKKPVTI